MLGARDHDGQLSRPEDTGPGHRNILRALHGMAHIDQDPDLLEIL